MRLDDADDGKGNFRMLEPPHDLHFAAARLCLEKRNVRPGVACRSLLSAWAIVIMEIFTAAALLDRSAGPTSGLSHPPCVSDGECATGRWCTASAFDAAGVTGAGRCLECNPAPSFCFANGTARASSAAVLTMEQLVPVGSRSHAVIDTTSVWQPTPDDHAALCGQCTRRGTFLIEVFHASVLGMSAPEWIALALVALVTACAIADEARDIAKVLLYVHAARESDGHATDEEQPLGLAAGGRSSGALSAAEIGAVELGVSAPPSSTVGGCPIYPCAVSSANGGGGGRFARSRRPSAEGSATPTASTTAASAPPPRCGDAINVSDAHVHVDIEGGGGGGTHGAGETTGHGTNGHATASGQHGTNGPHGTATSSNSSNCKALPAAAAAPVTSSSSSTAEGSGGSGAAARHAKPRRLAWRRGFVLCLLLLQVLRALVLAMLATLLPLLVTAQRADALSILLNTVATLFILEVCPVPPCHPQASRAHTRRATRLASLPLSSADHSPP